MPTVKLTRAEWDWVLMLLDDHEGAITNAVVDEINAQLDGQEY